MNLCRIADMLTRDLCSRTTSYTRCHLVCNFFTFILFLGRLTYFLCSSSSCSYQQKSISVFSQSKIELLEAYLHVRSPTRVLSNDTHTMEKRKHVFSPRTYRLLFPSQQQKKWLKGEFLKGDVDEANGRGSGGRRTHRRWRMKVTHVVSCSALCLSDSQCCQKWDRWRGRGRQSQEESELTVSLCDLWNNGIALRSHSLS